MSMTIFPATGQSGTEPNLSENTTPSTNNRNAEYRLNPINGGILPRCLGRSAPQNRSRTGGEIESDLTADQEPNLFRSIPSI